jgi:signal transduction histidine kinase
MTTSQPRRDAIPAAALVAHEVGHDLDEVRTAVTDLRAMVTRVAVDPRIGQAFDRLGRRVDRLDGTVRRMVRDAAGVQALTLAPVRLARLVDTVMEAHDPLGHRVEAEVSSAVVTLDAVKVERILDNLLLNALQHTPAGTRVWLQAWAPSGSEVVLGVEDDGPGLRPDRRDALTRPARDSDPLTGLTLVSRLAALHGGSLTLEPGRYGGGLRAEVRLATRGPS